MPGGHYQIVTEGNALGYSSMRNLCLEGSTPQDGSAYLGSCLASSKGFKRLSSYLVWVGVKFSNAKEEELLINDASQIGSKKFDFSIE